MQDYYNTSKEAYVPLLCHCWGGIKRWCASDVCMSDVWRLSRTSGLGRLKLAQMWPTSHVTRTPLSRSKGQKSRSRARRGHIVAASSTAC